MNIAKLLLLAFTLVTSSVQAKDTVIFFYDNQVNIKAVYKEFNSSRVSGHFQFTSYNVQEKDNATEQINDILSKVVAKKYNEKSKGYKAEEAYSKEFSLLMNNGSEWSAIVKRLEVGAASLGKMIELKVEKVPAFVFNDTDIVYGETSFEKAYRIYSQWKSNQ